ncbi:VOC family protein [Paenibacillus alkalitolerans]|uniref:VOC family protein n=1 Tax=Paenibacillus alkalitolerans TaxID=2799335 RepID=UPI0018F42CF9|nr:VOC family protein [Paenibacillus alkalitolerans]
MDLNYRYKSGTIRRLLTIRLPVSDLQSSVAWYCEHFGMVVLNEGVKHAELAVMENGVKIYPSLILSQTDAGHRLNYSKHGAVRSMIMMHASNMEGLFEKMVRSGAKVVLPHSGEEGDGCGRFFEATDPSGNVIQIQANDGETPANHTRVEAIFNLEIPVRDVRKSAHFYANVLGFQLIREPDDQLAIAKVGPFYESRFGYRDVQEFGFFLFRHDVPTPLHYLDEGMIQECLVLQADDLAGLREKMLNIGYKAGDLRKNESGEEMSFTIADPDENYIKVISLETINVSPGALTEEYVQ